MQLTRYDVVHNHAFDAPAIRLATALPAPVVHTLHLPPDEACPPRCGRQTRAAGRLRLPRCRCSRPAPGAALSASTRSCRLTRRRRHPLDGDAGSGALFAGRLSPEKGAAEAIDIAGAAGVPIDVYGDVYDPGYSREQIDRRRSWPGVTVHKAVSRASLWEAMARAAVVVYPARWDEPFGMAAAEAQACGTPVVAFRRGGLSEVIMDGVTGFLVPADDVRAAAEAVAQVAAVSRSACREHAENQLDLELSLDAHERLYQRVAGG